MGTGLPIITTNRGGNAEIIKHLENGYLIEDYTNPDAFVEAITYLFSNQQDADKLAKAGELLLKKNLVFYMYQSG